MYIDIYTSKASNRAFPSGARTSKRRSTASDILWLAADAGPARRSLMAFGLDSMVVGNE